MGTTGLKKSSIGSVHFFMDRPLIGLHGQIGTGKTTLANKIKDQIDPTQLFSPIIVDAFGNELKREVMNLFGIERRNLFTDEGKKDYASPEVTQLFWDKMEQEIGREATICIIDKHTYMLTYRKILQLWATEVRRKQNENYWVSLLSHKIQSYDGGFIIDDVRFINEAMTIRKLGGIIVKVHPYPGYNNPAGNHESEVALKEYSGFDLEVFPKFGDTHLEYVAEDIVNLISKSLLRIAK